ncbi:ABC transporter substrate-binding protein [Ructibacterium gallinarum]|uniref:Extracellular solute-binding protein n=1 Tax=Ructibacterium gallinarum TaxID=2779355 RepID=A0A9D5LZG7_9FIRM|nr:extracellular solute-binding protein [Ructibacterium gallinarum]MBE5040908.1 extracellular solute-binding protein [Ructibacterium gallinarum]
MKRILLVLCSIAMCFSVASCARNAEQTQGNGEMPTIVWYVPGDSQPNADKVMEKVSEITEKEIGARLNLRFIDQASFNQKLNMLMASGSDEYDLCFTGYTNVYSKAAEGGGLLELDEMLDNTPELKNSILEGVWNDARYNGHIYAVPNTQIFALSTSIELDKELVDKYNFDISTVKELKDIEPFLEMVKQNEPEIFPFRTANSEQWGLEQKNQYNKLSGRLYIKQDTGEIYRNLDLPEYKELMRLLNSWYNKGYIRKDVKTMNDDTADYNAGRYAAYMINWKPGMAESSKQRLGREKYYVKLSEPYRQQGICQETMTGINANCKNPDLALKMIELVNTNTDVYRLICHGIEGENYEKIDENTIRYIENSGYNPNADWKFGNQFNAYVLEGQPSDIWEQMKHINATAKESPLTGFTLNMGKISGLQNQTTTAVAQLKSLMVCSPDEFDDLYEKTNEVEYESGGKEILDDAKAQVEKFLETKNQ